MSGPDRTRLWRTARWVLIPLAVVAVGAISFLVSSRQPAKTPSAEARLVYVAPPHPGAFVRSRALRLAWGTGDGEVWRDAKTGVGTLEAVFSAGDRVYVVDHPGRHSGARVRWFSQDGRLLGRYLTPPGASLFTPRSAGGFIYDMAKQTQPSERLVAVDASGSVVATYTVPLQLNAGGIAEDGATLYAVGASSMSDPQRQQVSLRETLIPVAMSGRQVSESEAERGAVQAWGTGVDGRRYVRTQTATGAGASPKRTQTFSAENGKPLSLPGAAAIAGVDGKGRVYALEEGTLADSGKVLPEWPAVREPWGTLTVADLEGKVAAVLLVPDPPALRGMRARVSLSADGLLVPDADDAGVTVWRYAEATR